MARKSSSFSSSEEVVNHFGAVRLRVNGSGGLRLTLFSLDETQSNILSPIVVAAKTNIEPNRLSNFTQQRAKLQIKTTGLGETFQISKLIVFVKPVAKSFPEGAQVTTPGSTSLSQFIIPTGPTGPQGIQGIQGATGATGATGPAGTQIKPAFAQTVESVSYTLTGAYADVTSLSVSITPNATTSKVRVTASVSVYFGNGSSVVGLQILRGSTVLQKYEGLYNANTNPYQFTAMIEYLDSPASTSLITYKIQGKAEFGAGLINNPVIGGDIVTSTITVEEALG